jgi:hypothetical protein
MMAKKRKKNKIIFPVVLICCLGAMIAALLLLKNHNSKGPELQSGESTEAVTAFQRSGVIITKVQFKGKTEELSFVFENDMWKYAADDKFPVDSNAVDVIADSLMKVDAYMKVDTEGADVESFGLADKAEKITATFSDGRVVEFKFGIVNSYNGYQYFTYTDTSDIYLVDKNLLSSFEIELEDVYQSEGCQLVVDGAKEEDVTSVLISTKSGKQNAITDEKGCKALFTVMSYFNLSVWEDYYADEAEMKEKYGITKDGDRASINYTLTNYKENEKGEYEPYEVKKTYTVYFGNEFTSAEETENGGEGSENWKTFYTVEGSNVVYSISRDKVKALFDNMSYKPDAETDNKKEEATIE